MLAAKIPCAAGSAWICSKPEFGVWFDVTVIVIEYRVVDKLRDWMYSVRKMMFVQCLIFGEGKKVIQVLCSSLSGRLLWGYERPRC